MHPRLPPDPRVRGCGCGPRGWRRAQESESFGGSVRFARRSPDDLCAAGVRTLRSLRRTLRRRGLHDSRGRAHSRAEPRATTARILPAITQPAAPRGWGCERGDDCARGGRGVSCRQRRMAARLRRDCAIGDNRGEGVRARRGWPTQARAQPASAATSTPSCTPPCTPPSASPSTPPIHTLRLPSTPPSASSNLPPHLHQQLHPLLLPHLPPHLSIFHASLPSTLLALRDLKLRSGRASVERGADGGALLLSDGVVALEGCEVSVSSSLVVV